MFNKVGFVLFRQKKVSERLLCTVFPKREEDTVLEDRQLSLGGGDNRSAVTELHSCLARMGPGSWGPVAV